MNSRQIAVLRAPEMIVGALLLAVFFYFIFGDLVGLRDSPPEVAVRGDAFTVLPAGK